MPVHVSPIPPIKHCAEHMVDDEDDVEMRDLPLVAETEADAEEEDDDDDDDDEDDDDDDEDVPRYAIDPAV